MCGLIQNKAYSLNLFLQISTPFETNPIHSRWRNALMQLGWPQANLYDLENQYGTTIAQITQSINNRTRQTTASAYIETNIARPNLHVLLNAQVTRVLFNNTFPGTIPVASGVEFIRNGLTYQVGTLFIKFYFCNKKCFTLGQR